MEKLTRSEQARINGKKSRGPKTQAGRIKCAAANLKHGRYAFSTAVLPVEDPRAFDDLVKTYLAIIRPQNQAEYACVEDLASVQIDLHRLRAIEAGVFSMACERQSAADNAAQVEQNNLRLLASAADNLLRESPTPAYVSRRQAQLYRRRREIYFHLRQLRTLAASSPGGSQIIPDKPVIVPDEAPDPPRRVPGPPMPAPPRLPSIAPSLRPAARVRAHSCCSHTTLGKWFRRKGIGRGEPLGRKPFAAEPERLPRRTGRPVVPDGR